MLHPFALLRILELAGLQGLFSMTDPDFLCQAPRHLKAAGPARDPIQAFHSMTCRGLGQPMESHRSQSKK